MNKLLIFVVFVSFVFNFTSCNNAPHYLYTNLNVDNIELDYTNDSTLSLDTIFYQSINNNDLLIRINTCWKLSKITKEDITSIKVKDLKNTLMIEIDLNKERNMEEIKRKELRFIIKNIEYNKNHIVKIYTINHNQKNSTAVFHFTPFEIYLDKNTNGKLTAE